MTLRHASAFENVHQPTKQSPGPSLLFPHSVITPHRTHPQLNAVEVVHQARVQVGAQLYQLLGKDEADLDPDVILPQLDQRHALQAPPVAGLPR